MTKNYWPVLLLAILIFAAGYFLHDVINKPIITETIINVVTKEDSTRISNNALILASAKFSQFTILPDGSWIRREPQIVTKYKPGTHEIDTVYIDTTKYANVATLDTTLTFKKDSVVTKSTLSLKFAYEIGALNFKYTSSTIDSSDSSYYKLDILGDYFNGKWKINLTEDLFLKKKTVYITKESKSYPNPAAVRFWDRFVYGPTVSVGYGTFNRTFDTFIGFGVTYNIR